MHPENAKTIKLDVAQVLFPVRTLGSGERLCVWVRGCSRHCPDCASPEFQLRSGPGIPIRQLLEQLPRFPACTGLTVSGGEPFDQVEGILELVRWFQANYSDDVLLYTGYMLQELHRRRQPQTEELIHAVAAIVDGPYRKEENDGRGLRGSANQKLYVFRHPERYADFLQTERKLQAFSTGERIVMVGIPDPVRRD